MKKRASLGGTPKGADANKKPKQQSLKDSFMNAKTSPGPLPVVVSNTDVATLKQAYIQELESAIENYLQNWGEKSVKNSDLSVGGADRADIDLDSRGIQVVTAFRQAAQFATVYGVSLPPQSLEALVAIIRNDVVHQKSFVSRAAFSALMAYFESHPYAKLQHYSGAEKLPYVLITPSNVWLPLEEDRTSLTSKYLLVPDMSISGCNYQADRTGEQRHRKKRDSKWSCPAELMMHCIQKAIKSAEVDFNGDLQLYQYLIAVMEQDLHVRLEAHSQLEERGGAEATLGRRRGLLENSLAWRVFAGQLVSNDMQREIVRGLVALMTSDDAEEASIGAAEEEPEDDAQAGACVFTRPELAALAARNLRLILRLFGAAEASGAFLATGKHRSAAVNYRIALDGHLLEAFWSEKGLCKRPEAARALLRALPPRDCLRLLGLLAAQKFTRTYDTSSLGVFGKLIGDLAPYMQSTHSMLTRGTDIGSFFEVDLCPVVASLHREPARAAKTYKSPDHLAVMLAAVAVAAQALKLTGEEVPTGPDGIEGLKKELATAVAAVAGLTKGGDEGEKKEKGALQLSPLGVCDLTLAQMTVAAL